MYLPLNFTECCTAWLLPHASHEIASIHHHESRFIAGRLFYVDKDHFGNDELYKHLDQPDPNAPPVPAESGGNESGTGHGRLEG